MMADLTKPIGTKPGEKPSPYASSNMHYQIKSDPDHPWGNNWLLSKIHIDEKGYVWLRPNSPLVARYGCTACPWKKSALCDYDGKHTNGYCSKRIIHIKDLHDNFKKGTASQLLQMDQMMRTEDNVSVMLAEINHLEQLECLDDKSVNARDKKIERLKDRIAYAESQLTNQLDKFRKQEEGSKVKVENVADKLRGVMTVDAIEVEELEHKDV